MTPRSDLQAALSAALTLDPDASPDTIAATVADLRQCVADGLANADAEGLRTFVTVAGRFGHHVDVWNATRLLEGIATLDPLAKLARARAWLSLFPGTARRRPGIITDLTSGEPDLTDAARCTLLVDWLDRTRIDGHHDRWLLEDAVDDVIAVDQVATDWWTPNEWARRANAFATAYVDVAQRAAGEVDHLDQTRRSAMAQVWARALVLSSALGPDGPEGPPDDADDSADGQQQPNADDALDRVAAAISEGRRRIWVVGGRAAHWNTLTAVAGRLGISSNLLERVDYDDLKGRPLTRRAHVRDAGVLLGPVPHSARGVGSYSSPAVQLRHELGIPVIELRERSSSQRLRISKRSFEEGLITLLTELAATEPPPKGGSIEQPLRHVHP
jgi:hypothetical protein